MKRIVCLGGGPAGLYAAILFKKALPGARVLHGVADEVAQQLPEERAVRLDDASHLHVEPRGRVPLAIGRRDLLQRLRQVHRRLP